MLEAIEAQLIAGTILVALTFLVSRTLKLPGQHADLRKDFDALREAMPRDYMPRTGTRDDPGVMHYVGRLAKLEDDHVGQVEFSKVAGQLDQAKQQGMRDHAEIKESIGSVRGELAQLRGEFRTGMDDARHDAQVHTEILAVLKEIRSNAGAQHA